jgi:hypothetical protein
MRIQQAISFVKFNHLYSDHGPSTSHLARKNQSACLSPWITHLEKYSLVIEYRKGSLHGNAESLSRWPQRWPRNDYNYIIISRIILVTAFKSK